MRREPARTFAVQASGSVICSASTAHSLPGVEGERTVLLRSGAVKVRLRRSSRARRLRLVLVPGRRPRARRPGSRARRARSTARLQTLAPWLERALARQQPHALGLARPGVAWHGGEAVAAAASSTAKRASAGWSAGALELRAPDAAGAADGARALVPQLGARTRSRPRSSARRRGSASRRKAVAVRDQRTRWGSCSARGHALVLVAPAARSGLGARRRRLPRALPPARRQPLAGRSGGCSRRYRPGADSRPWLRAHGG